MDEYLDHIFDCVDSSIRLDEEQKQVVQSEDDYALVIAGAGSGKTTTMAARIKYLVEKKKVDPKNILMFSFTNKAVDELKLRIQEEFQIPVSIYTFHQFGFHLLKKLGIQKQILVDSKVFLEENIQTLIRTNLVFRSKFFQYFGIPSKIFSPFISILFQMIQKSLSYQKFISLCDTFYHGMKMRGFQVETFSSTNPTENSFYSLMKILFSFYKKEKNHSHVLDFDDLIWENIEILPLQNITFPYEYIIVDEYQDTSFDRFLFLKEILLKSGSKLMVVGDDFQSIFAFAGSDISLFLNFKKYFPTAHIYTISNTYRNSQELITIAGNFIMKNPFQISKNLSSSKHLQFPISIFVYDSKKKSFACEKALEKIVSSYGEFVTVLLLGRFHFDLSTIIDQKHFKFVENKIISTRFPHVSLTFLTIHASKGLGFPHVILLNSESGKYGFPSMKKTDPILKSVLFEDQTYLYAEERRLFYVALTRTKNTVSVLTPFLNPSCFIKELNGVNVIFCSKKKWKNFND